jgi:hypothetical protein
VTLLLALLLAGAPAAEGRILRSRAPVRRFIRETPRPERCSPPARCVVDHVIPLCAGGPDDPANMAWMGVEDARVKDRLEVAMCRARLLLGPPPKRARR